MIDFCGNLISVIRAIVIAHLIIFQFCVNQAWASTDGNLLCKNGAVKHVAMEKNAPSNGSYGYSADKLEFTYVPSTEELGFELIIGPDKNGILPNGFQGAINLGYKPLGHDGEFAWFVFDAIKNILTVYAYNAAGTNSWLDGSKAPGIQPPDRIVSSITTPEFLKSVKFKDNTDGTRTLGFTMDTSFVNNHVPLYPDPDGKPWVGIKFGEAIGVWVSAWNLSSTTYNAEGFLTDLKGSRIWMRDYNNRPTTKTYICSECNAKDPVQKIFNPFFYIEPAKTEVPDIIKSGQHTLAISMEGQKDILVKISINFTQVKGGYYQFYINSIEPGPDFPAEFAKELLPTDSKTGLNMEPIIKLLKNLGCVLEDLHFNVHLRGGYVPIKFVVGETGTETKTNNYTLYSYVNVPVQYDPTDRIKEPMLATPDSKCYLTIPCDGGLCVIKDPYFNPNIRFSKNDDNIDEARLTVYKGSHDGKHEPIVDFLISVHSSKLHIVGVEKVYPCYTKEFIYSFIPEDFKGGKPAHSFEAPGINMMSFYEYISSCDKAGSSFIKITKKSGEEYIFPNPHTYTYEDDYTLVDPGKLPGLGVIGHTRECTPSGNTIAQSCSCAGASPTPEPKPSPGISPSPSAVPSSKPGSSASPSASSPPKVEPSTTASAKPTPTDNPSVCAQAALNPRITDEFNQPVADQKGLELSVYVRLGCDMIVDIATYAAKIENGLMYITLKTFRPDYEKLANSMIPMKGMPGVDLSEVKELLADSCLNDMGISLTSDAPGNLVANCEKQNYLTIYFNNVLRAHYSRVVLPSICPQHGSFDAQLDCDQSCLEADNTGCNRLCPLLPLAGCGGDPTPSATPDSSPEPSVDPSATVEPSPTAIPDASNKPVVDPGDTGGACQPNPEQSTRLALFDNRIKNYADFMAKASRQVARFARNSGQTDLAKEFSALSNRQQTAGIRLWTLTWQDLGQELCSANNELSTCVSEGFTKTYGTMQTEIDQLIKTQRLTLRELKKRQTEFRFKKIRKRIVKARKMALAAWQDLSDKYGKGNSCGRAS